MKGNDIFDALGDTKDTHLAEAEAYKAKTRKTLLLSRVLAAAACLCLIVGVAAGARNRTGTDDPQPDPETPYLAVPKLSLSAKVGQSADMIGFMIHDGRVYVEYDAEDVDIGSYVCTTSGLIDEWTEKDGYVDGAGTIIGDFYEVKGYDPAFLLARVDPIDDGKRMLYVNNSGMYLPQGSQLLMSRFHITGTETDIRYLSREDWFYGEAPVPQQVSTETVGAVQELLGILGGAPFAYMEKEFPEFPTVNGGSIYDTLERFHLYVKTADGVVVHLRLLEGGYVLVDHFYDVCMKVPENGMKCYETVLKLLGKE